MNKAICIKKFSQDVELGEILTEKFVWGKRMYVYESSTKVDLYFDADVLDKEKAVEKK